MTAEQLHAWAEDSHTGQSVRYHEPQFKNPAEIRAAVLALLDELAATRQERDFWKAEYEFVGGINKALVPYQERAVAAEGEARALRDALQRISKIAPGADDDGILSRGIALGALSGGGGA